MSPNIAACCRGWAVGGSRACPLLLVLPATHRVHYRQKAQPLSISADASCFTPPAVFVVLCRYIFHQQHPAHLHLAAIWLVDGGSEKVRWGSLPRGEGQRHC